MNAILSVDLQSVGVVFVLYVLVDTGRAIARLRSVELGQVDLHGNAGVFQRQVRGLMFFVVGVADEHAGQAIEGQLAIGLGIDDGLAFSGRLQVQMVGLVAMQRPRNVALECELLDAASRSRSSPLALAIAVTVAPTTT